MGGLQALIFLGQRGKSLIVTSGQRLEKGGDGYLNPLLSLGLADVKKFKGAALEFTDGFNCAIISKTHDILFQTRERRAIQETGLSLLMKCHNYMVTFIRSRKQWRTQRVDTAGPKICDLPFQFMSEKGRRDSIIGTNMYWAELLDVKEESREKSTQTLSRSCTFKTYCLRVHGCDGAVCSRSIFDFQEVVREGYHGRIGGGVRT
jgi:hypothetical protein